jgi:transcriptional antiterminator RfaH
MTSVISWRQRAFCGLSDGPNVATTQCRFLRDTIVSADTFLYDAPEQRLFDMDSESALSHQNGESLLWFCVRSQPKREHIAAAHLRRLEGVEVFNPRLRIKKATRRGVVTFVESLFPNYLFARFDPQTAFNSVRYSPSVSTIVHFGERVAAVPDETIATLREEFGPEELLECERHVSEGDVVTIGEGPFLGMTARVLKVLTPHQRVEVLLEFLGRHTSAIVNPNSLVVENQR